MNDFDPAELVGMADAGNYFGERYGDQRTKRSVSRLCLVGVKPIPGAPERVRLRFFRAGAGRPLQTTHRWIDQFIVDVQAAQELAIRQRHGGEPVAHEPRDERTQRDLERAGLVEPSVVVEPVAQAGGASK